MVIVNLGRTAKTKEKVENEPLNNEMAREDRRYIHIMVETSLQALHQIHLHKERLKYHQVC